MMGHGGMGWGGMIGMVVFWLVLIALIVWAVSRLLPGRHVRTDRPQPGQETPEEMLDRRFARGEVDLETYQVQRAALASVMVKRAPCPAPGLLATTLPTAL